MADMKIKTWQMKAKFGDATAMNNLGLAYREGTGVEKDLSESVNWFFKAASAGSLEATYNMAMAFLRGEGTNKDIGEGLKWLELAAELGHKEAMYEMYIQYNDKYVGKSDLEKAFYWLEKSAEDGNVLAMRLMGEAYSLTNYMSNVQVDMVKSAAWYEKAAEAGDADAMNQLGLYHRQGKGVEKDDAKAFEWYKKSAEAGYAIAKGNLGFLYLNGYGVEKDYAKAYEWFKAAADDGRGYGMYYLGQMYTNGQGVEKDDVIAAEWYKKSAEAGYSSGMNAIAKAYAFGTGIEKNFDEAIVWFRKAAQAGVAESMAYLGEMLEKGFGTERNAKEAVEWYQKGATAGSEKAMLRLGAAYLEGVGTDKNPEEAEKWLLKVAQRGWGEAYVLLAKSKLNNEKGLKAAREAVALLQKVKSKDTKGYNEVWKKAQTIIEYEESFLQIMQDKFGCTIEEQVIDYTSALEELDGMIGLEKVKEEVHGLKSFVEVQRKMQEMGRSAQKMSYHMVFTGNPGTGKTTVARIIARVLYEIGIIPTDKLVECDRKSLVSEYKNQTAIKTQGVIDSALGGVLFIDEAYTLSVENDTHGGKEAIDTLLKAMEDNRDNLVVIVAGYTNEMREFMNSNPGLQSRFNTYLDFEDYTVPELVRIFKLTCDSKGYMVSSDAWSAVINEMTKLSRNKSDKFANGRDVRNFFEKVLKKQNIRISRKGIDNLSEMDFLMIVKQDIQEEEGVKLPNQKSALDELDKLIGLNSVKTEVRNLKMKIAAQKKLREMGRNVENASMHMVFTGNPGTGKTTVARIIAQIFYEIGVISTNKLVECDRASLVAEYIGQTATKTQKVIDSAIGGVLFIDEAYTLSPKSTNDFGSEAINTILKAMEDNRDNLIVIAAGYQKEMQDFLATNPGLESRFKYFIDFPDYTKEEMFEIFKVYCAKEEYGISKEAEEGLKEHFAGMEAQKGEKFGNGRDVRNYYERVVQRVLVRFTEAGDEATAEDLIIRAEDVVEN